MLPCGCNEQSLEDDELDESIFELSESSDDEIEEEEEEEAEEEVAADVDVDLNAVDEDDVNDTIAIDGNAVEQIINNNNNNINNDVDENYDYDNDGGDDNAGGLSSESDDTSDDTDGEEESQRLSINWMGSSQMRARLRDELTELRRNPIQGCVANPVNTNFFEWIVTFHGPADTPYEGGVFEIKISFTNGYPSGPPTLKFITKIYHCNVHMDTVCVDQWSAHMTVSELMQWLIATMTTPNLEDPMNPAIVKLYTTHRSEHDKIAREWTQHFAMK